MRALRLSIRTKLLATSLLLLALAGVISVLAIAQLSTVKHKGSDLYHHAYTPTVGAVYINSLAKDLSLQTATYNILMMQNGGDAVKVSHDKAFPAIIKAVKADSAGLARTVK